jgi:hypothetical protein
VAICTVALVGSTTPEEVELRAKVAEYVPGVDPAVKTKGQLLGDGVVATNTQVPTRPKTVAVTPVEVVPAAKVPDPVGRVAVMVTARSAAAVLPNETVKVLVPAAAMRLLENDAPAKYKEPTVRARELGKDREEVLTWLVTDSATT